MSKLKTKAETKAWLKEMEIKKYTINDDLTVDINDDVILLGVALENIPIQFGIVKGDFVCYYSNLKTLDNHPEECNNFDCTDTPLTKEYLDNFDFSFVKGKVCTGYDDIDNKWKKINSLLDKC